MSITPAVSSTGDPGFIDPANVRSVVERRAAIAKGRPGQSDGLVIELRGPDARGFYYVSSEATQSQAVARCLTTGIVITGPLLLSTEIRSAQPDSASVQMGIAMLESARHRPQEKTFESMSRGQLIGSRMTNRQEEVSFPVPGGWVVDDRVPMGIRHETSDASFAVFKDDLVTLSVDLRRASGEDTAPDTDAAVRIHKLTLRDSLDCDYTLVQEKPRQVGRVRFRELILVTVPADGEARRVHDFVAWYRSRAFVLRFSAPVSRVEDTQRFLDEILGSLNLKDRG